MICIRVEVGGNIFPGNISAATNAFRGKMEAWRHSARLVLQAGKAVDSKGNERRDEDLLSQEVITAGEGGKRVRARSRRERATETAALVEAEVVLVLYKQSSILGKVVFHLGGVRTASVTQTYEGDDGLLSTSRNKQTRGRRKRREWRGLEGARVATRTVGTPEQNMVYL